MPCCGISLRLEVDHAMQDTKFVVDSGPLKVRKLLGIPIGMPQLPDVRGDMALVVRNRAGGLWPLSSPTSGEKAWGDYETWYLVDMASREFANSYNDVLLTSDAGFDISITAAVQVIDPAQAVVHQNRKLTAFVDPILRKAIDDAIYRFYERNPDFRPRSAGELSQDVDLHGRPNLGSRWLDSEKIYSMRLASQRELYSALAEKELGGDDWLSISVTGLSVQIDADTRAHLNEIRSGRRATELTAVHHQQSETEALSKMKIRQMWRNELKKYLTDRSMRMFEEVYDDPTPEKISAAVAKVDANEQGQMKQLLGVVEYLMEKGTIHSDEE
jgi:hypothetical protein